MGVGHLWRYIICLLDYVFGFSKDWKNNLKMKRKNMKNHPEAGDYGAPFWGIFLLELIILIGGYYNGH